MQLEKFTVEGLFDRYDVSLTIVDNTIILVGENGSGKSTILSILNYFLTQQWGKLYDLPFRMVSAVVNGHPVSLNREALKAQAAQGRAMDVLRPYLHPRQFDEVRDVIAHNLQDSPFPGSLPDLRILFPWINLPEHIWREFTHAYVYDAYISERHQHQKPKELTRAKEILTAQVDQQILYLPTYRRIERDLQHVLRSARIERDTSRFHSELSQDIGYVELVEFGMKDVSEAFTTTMRHLDQSFRGALAKLSVTYLRDIINDTYRESASSFLASAKTLHPEQVIERMDDGIILTPVEQKKLLGLVGRIRNGEDITDNDMVVAHYLSMLLQVHNSQSQLEQYVVDLVDMCSNYLSGKRLVFNPHKFELKFMLTDEDGATVADLSPDALSSGEKQIVSLFTHMFLSKFAVRAQIRPDSKRSRPRSQHFVIIDEPELSISVEWQKRFLLDIRSAPTCGGMIAVTHSPFLFLNNDLQRYFTPIEQHKKVRSKSQDRTGSSPQKDSPQSVKSKKRR